MRKRLLLSVLMSIGIVVGGFGLAYAFGTFNASQQGFRQFGEGESARITMQVEAGTPDGDSALVPDGSSCVPASVCPGGALDFTITNTSDFPIAVTGISGVTSGFPAVLQAWSNKNEDGSLGYNPGSPNCGTHVTLRTPADFRTWPTIAAHATLHVNGTDTNQLGAGMLHLNNSTPDGCQGALYAVRLNVTATEATNSIGANGFPNP